jgi:hypothetical protein
MLGMAVTSPTRRDTIASRARDAMTTGSTKMTR